MTETDSNHTKEEGVAMDIQLETILRGSEFKQVIGVMYEEIRKKYDLKKIEVQVLYALHKGENCDTPTVIAKQFKLNRTHVSQAIDRLCKNKIVISKQDEKDRRCTHYFLTEEAKKIADEAAQIHAVLEEKVLKGISEAELQLFKEVSEKIVNNIHEIIEV
jgi:DNA-binding MarR family transcriptional regulator